MFMSFADYTTFCVIVRLRKYLQHPSTWYQPIAIHRLKPWFSATALFKIIMIQAPNEHIIFDDQIFKVII